MNRVEQGTKAGSGLNEDFWLYAKNYNLLPQLVERGKMTEEQIEVLRRFFEGKGLKKKRPEPTELLDKLSIIVARHAVGLELL